MDPEPTDELPGELRAFLHSHIDAIEQLEILVVSYKSQRWWSVPQIAAELRMSAQTANRHLETLAQRGLLDVRLFTDLLYRYEPVSDNLRHGVELLVDYYQESRAAVVRFVMTRSRRSIKDFADAFRLRRQE